MTGAGEAAPTSLKTQLIEWGRAAVPSIVSAVGFTGLISALGAGVVWMRFNTAGIPGDQALHDLPLSESLVPGAVALILYLVLGLAAVLLVYLLQEAVVESVVENANERKDLLRRELTLRRKYTKELEEELARLAPEGKFPEPGTPAADVYVKTKAERDASVKAAEELSKQLFDAEERDARSSGRGSRWGTLVLAGAELIVVMLRTEVATAWKVIFAIATAGIAALVVLGAFGFVKDKRSRLMVGVGSLAVLVVFAVVLVLEQHWTFVPVLAALLFALANLAIGRLHPRSFFWYGITIFASVGVFGAVLTYSRDVNAPSAQPAALLLKNGCVVRGLWVGESSSRVYLARLARPSEASETSPPSPPLKFDTGRVFWVDRSQMASESVGKLRRVPVAEDESGALRGELLALNTGAKLTEKQCSEATGNQTGTPAGGTSAKKG